MKTTVTGRHVDVTPKLHELVQQKLEKLERHLGDNAISAQVILVDGHNERAHEHTVEIVLHARGDHVLRGEGRAEAWGQAVSAAVDKVDQQAHTLKGKWETRRRRPSPTGSGLRLRPGSDDDFLA